MDCELCGRQDTLVSAIVEATTMHVCRVCARFGHVIPLEKPPELIKEERRKQARLDIPKEYIAEDYGDLIKKARENRKFTQSQLAIILAEKESIIHKLESYYLEPSIELARKLEKYLNIKLVYESSDANNKKFDFHNEGITLGDIMKLKK